MDSLLAVTGDGFALIASDASAARSILRLKETEDKIMKLDSHKLLAGAGPTGDRVQFSEFVQKNVNLYRFRNDTSLSTHATANFIRGELADALRSAPYQVNLLLAGWDEQDGTSLYWMDYLASMQKMDFAAHGYAGYFAFSVLDRHFKKNMNLEEGLELIKLCIQEVATRFVMNQSTWYIKIVDKHGARLLEVLRGGKREDAAVEEIEKKQ